jgi:hypothetical protein
MNKKLVLFNYVFELVYNTQIDSIQLYCYAEDSSIEGGCYKNIYETQTLFCLFEYFNGNNYQMNKVIENMMIDLIIEYRYTWGQLPNHWFRKGIKA